MSTQKRINVGDQVYVSSMGANKSPQGTILEADSTGVTVEHEDHAGNLIAFYPWSSIQRLVKKA